MTTTRTNQQTIGERRDSCFERVFRWIRIGLACHNILQEAFCRIFEKDPGSKGNISLASLMSGILQDLTGEPVGDAVAPGNSSALEAAIAPFVHPDVPIGKVQGVRARKSCTWIRRPQTLSELLIAVLSTKPVSGLSQWLLHQQGSNSYLSRDPTERPAVCCATLRYNPAVKAISESVNMLRSGLEGIVLVFDGDLPKQGPNKASKNT